jgi:hypothetical protein
MHSEQSHLKAWQQLDIDMSRYPLVTWKPEVVLVFI